IITENIPATVKWDNNNINKLVHNYFILCQKALQSEPDLIIWTESAVPWTYTPNEDFLDSIASMSKQPYHNVSHIIGMNTAIDHNSVYNSAHFIKNGKTDNRQNKNSLLSLVETPLFNINLPFLQTDEFKAVAGNNINIFNQNGIGLGVLI